MKRKKEKCKVTVAVLAIFLAGCSVKKAEPTLPKKKLEETEQFQKEIEESQEEKNQFQKETEESSKIEFDYDLTQLSSTVLYSQVTDMLMLPEEYAGKTVKMRGRFEVYGDPEKENPYLACIVNDATACCSVGLRVVLNDSYTSADFPSNGADVIVTGIYQTYEYERQIYGELEQADMIVVSDEQGAVG